jgi:Holliday junction resolvase RusA-like endonuclease
MAVRKRESIGQYFINSGSQIEFDDTLIYELDKTRKFYMFDVCPVSAPRMTQSDRWKTNPNHPDINKRQRPSVTRYFDYKTKLKLQGNLMNFEMIDVLDVLFLIPMPKSWSKKKKKSMNALPCKVKPDTDNLTKAIKDTFCKDDSHIWRETAEKRWAYCGAVIIFQ